MKLRSLTLGGRKAGYLGAEIDELFCRIMAGDIFGRRPSGGSEVCAGQPWRTWLCESTGSGGAGKTARVLPGRAIAPLLQSLTPNNSARTG